MFYYLHRCPVNIIQLDSADTLILGAKPRRLSSPLFYTGLILFIISMLTRGFMANAVGHIAVLPLGLSTLLLISAVWHFSATPKVIFTLTDGKLYLVYKHLGYLQKVYTHSLANIEDAKQVKSVNGTNILKMRKDNGEFIWLAQGKDDYSAMVKSINTFLISYNNTLKKPL